MSWINIAITVGAAVVSEEQQRAVAHKQDNVLAANLRQQQDTEQKVAARNAQFAQQQQQQTDQPQKTAAANAYQAALKANQAQATAPLATVGNVSDAYKKAGSDAALGISDYGKNLGNLTASIDAPTQQRRDNQKNIDNFGIDVNQINKAQRGQDFLSQLKFNGIHANPYVGLLTSVARAYAGSQGGGGFGGGSTDLDGNVGAGGIDLRQPASTAYPAYDPNAQSPWLTRVYGGK